MPKRAAHGDDLTLVMEGVGQDMMDDECGRANLSVSVGKTKLSTAVELLIRQTCQVCEGQVSSFALQESGIS